MLTPTGEDVGMSQQGKITRDQFPHTSPMPPCRLFATLFGEAYGIFKGSAGLQRRKENESEFQ